MNYKFCGRDTVWNTVWMEILLVENAFNLTVLRVTVWLVLVCYVLLCFTCYCDVIGLNFGTKVGNCE